MEATPLSPEHDRQFEIAAQNFVNAFLTIPYDEMTAEQKELADSAKAYIEKKHPDRTLH